MVMMIRCRIAEQYISLQLTACRLVAGRSCMVDGGAAMPMPVSATCHVMHGPIPTCICSICIIYGSFVCGVLVIQGSCN